MKSMNHILMRFLILCFFSQNVLIAQASTNQHADMANCDDSQMMTMSQHENHPTQTNNIQENENIDSCHDEACSSMCQFACQVTTLLPDSLIMLQPSPDILKNSRPKPLAIGHAFLLLRPPTIL
jgi:hypothetical protein